MNQEPAEVNLYRVLLNTGKYVEILANYWFNGREVFSFYRDNIEVAAIGAGYVIYVMLMDKTAWGGSLALPSAGDPS